MEFTGTLNVVNMQGGHSLTDMALADHVTKSGLDIRSPNMRLRRLREPNLAVTQSYYHRLIVHGAIALPCPDPTRPLEVGKGISGRCSLFVTVPVKRVLVAHLFKIELLLP